MKKPRKDPVRENRIHEEAIVDAYQPVVKVRPGDNSADT